MRQSSRQPLIKSARYAVLGVLSLVFLYSGDDHPSLLKQVQERGSLTLLTRTGASSYYLGANGPTGPEYQLVLMFSRYLGVVLDVEVAETISDLKSMLNDGEGEVIAANFARSAERERLFDFGPDYLHTQVLAVTRRDANRPENMGDLVGLHIMVLSGSIHEEILRDARLDYPDLKWESRDDVSIEDLLLAVADEAIDVTLVDANSFAINWVFHPLVNTAFVVEANVPHAWAFRHGDDDSLVEQADAFMLQASVDGRLAGVLRQFEAPDESLAEVDMFNFLQRARAHLPQLMDAFREAGAAYAIDWRLLAAVGYQESHWDPLAASSTGVRGIMMLTEQTAVQLGVTDRLDPEQSIDGGSRYIARLRARLPSDIHEPDRTWMALAAYNMGLGHLHDARKLADQKGLDPDSWSEVSSVLGLLSQEKWYRQTRHGYARGFEAKIFVESIQRYYQTLLWMDTHEHPLLVAGL
jgi:membrane-bound lytic murein transglycosylase F